MAAWGSDFLIIGDFDAVMTIIHAVMLENDTEILSEVNYFPTNLLSARKSWQHHCHICPKIGLSQSGLSRQTIQTIYCPMKNPQY